MSVDERLRSEFAAAFQAHDPDVASALADVETGVLRRRMRRHAALAVAAAVLALITVAVGPEVLASLSDERDMAPVQMPTEEQRVQAREAYIEAWNAEDADAIVAMMSPNEMVWYGQDRVRCEYQALFEVLDLTLSFDADASGFVLSGPDGYQPPMVFRPHPVVPVEHLGLPDGTYEKTRAHLGAAVAAELGVDLTHCASTPEP